VWKGFRGEDRYWSSQRLCNVHVLLVAEVEEARGKASGLEGRRGLVAGVSVGGPIT
jgi:hypothetical protein